MYIHIYILKYKIHIKFLEEYLKYFQIQNYVNIFNLFLH